MRRPSLRMAVRTISASSFLPSLLALSLVPARRSHRSLSGRLGGRDGGDALGLADQLVGLLEAGAGELAQLAEDRGSPPRRGRAPRLLGGLLGEPDDRVDDGLRLPVGEHHRAEHDVLGKLLGLGS